MKPSVQDATHFDTIYYTWYKIGETTSYYWSIPANGWKALCVDPDSVRKEEGFITAQEALERGYKYPQYPTTTKGVIVDSTGSGEVLEASPVPVCDLPDSNTTYRKTVDDLYEDHFDKVKKINEAISHHPYITYEQHQLLLDNGYRVNSVGVFKGGVLQIKPSEQTIGFGPVYASAAELNKKWRETHDSFSGITDFQRGVKPAMITGQHQQVPLTPDMTEANDKRVNTTSANNRQVGGDHYKKMKIQPWDLFGSIFNLDEQIGFYLGNVYKYLMRYDSKNGIEDLMKAKHYLEKLIEVKRGAASADVGDDS